MNKKKLKEKNKREWTFVSSDRKRERENAPGLSNNKEIK